VEQYLRSRKLARAATGFARKLHSLRQPISLGNFSTKKGLRGLLLTYRQLQRRQDSALAVLEPVNYFPYTPSPAVTRFTAMLLARRSQRKRHHVRARTRAKQLRFSRENAVSMLFARLQPYYHSRVLGTKYDRFGGGKSLRELDAAIALHQAAFADSSQLTKTIVKTSVGRQSLRVPGLKAKRLRALFNLYTSARLSQIGCRRSSQLGRDRRTVAAYERRYSLTKSRAGFFISRQTYYHQRCRRLALRGSPAGLLKLAISRKLCRRARLQLTRR